LLEAVLEVKQEIELLAEVVQEVIAVPTIQKILVVVLLPKQF
tara:strand:- start:398 stop:523 length:126 start_codon:yes stop_codon:yes gene_type:complete